MKNYRDVKEGSLRDYFRGIDGEVNIQVEQVGDNYMLNQIRIKDYRNIDFTQDNHLALMNITDNIKLMMRFVERVILVQIEVHY